MLAKSTDASEHQTNRHSREANVRWLNVPNILTLARLCLGIACFVLISLNSYLAAVLVFGLAAVTDALDGYFARLLNQTSALGRQLDPLVDKILVIGAMIHLLPIEGTGLAPWMVTVIVARELVIQALRSMFEGQGVAFGARWSGKLKTVLQCLAIVFVLICLAFPRPSLLFPRDMLLWSAVLLTIYSGIEYCGGAWSKIRASGSST